MSRILVTGAGGFIGSHLAKRLFENGHYVRVVDIKWDGYFKEPYYSEKQTLDLRNQDNCSSAIRDIDYVFNLAADMGGIGYITSIGANIMRNSGLINMHMIHVCALSNTVKRLFFSSSACMYPTYKQLDSNVTALKESDGYPAAPDSFYGWEKLFAEQMCQAYREDYGLDVVIARFHNIYGPYGTWDGGKEKAPAALCRKIAMAENGDTIDIWGDGDQTRSFCYIDDCVDGVITLMKSGYPHPLNIGTDELVSINILVSMISDIANKNIERNYILDAPQGVRGRNADLTLVKKAIGWQPKVSLYDGLCETYKWIEQQVKKSEKQKEKE